MKNKLRRLFVRLQEPIIVDRKIDIVSGLSWLAIGLFGVFYWLGDISTIQRLAGPDYTLIWGAAIGLLGMLSAAAAFSTLITSDIHVRIRKKQAELIFLCLFGGVLVVYPIFKVAALVVPPFNLNEIANLAVSIYFMILPTWRVFHLVKRIRALRSVMNGNHS